MAVSFYRFLVYSESVCVVRCASSLLTRCRTSEKLVSACRLIETRVPEVKMPPKRKATATKVAKNAAAAKADDVAAENGASGDAPKTKKGKAASKEVAAAEEPKPKRGRTAKAPLKETEDENVEVEQPKETKPRGRKPKTDKTEQEARPTRARAAKEKVPEDPPEDKPKTTKAKKTEPKKKAAKAEAKPRKGRAAAAKSETEDDTSDSAKPDLQNDTETNYSKINFTCTRKNANGETFNLKISSWNVDGLRALAKKNGHLFVEHEDPDVLCLQEIKCREEQLPSEIKDLEQKYTAYWCSSEKEGYAGVGLLTKVEPISIDFGIGDEEHDEDGRCITAEYEKFYVVNVYVPNAGRKLVTLPKRLEWNAAFKTYINSLDKKKPVVVCGDMNVAHHEVDLANPKTNKKNAGFTQEERDGMTDFLDDGYVDTYRKMYSDKTGVYTFWSYMMKSRSKNIGWRLDYFIVSERLMDNICDNVVRSEVLGSDHCPITLFLNV